VRRVFQARGVDLDAPIVVSCGSGLTACILALALCHATHGRTLAALYDGSWSEWGNADGVPVER
jgi:thiosulfate/3-mercaptopyruvate sulfurtransferase